MGLWVRSVFSIVVLVLGLAGCLPGGATFEQVGYFKGAGGNRVFVLHAAGVSDASEVRAHAEAQAHTEGRFTVVYVFNDASPPPDVVTLAGSYPAANLAVAAIGGYRWRLDRLPSGRVEFRDCSADRCG